MSALLVSFSLLSPTKKEIRKTRVVREIRVFPFLYVALFLFTPPSA
jgi:hypothetical protein